MRPSYFQVFLIDALMLRVRFLSRELRLTRRRFASRNLYLTRDTRSVPVLETSFGRTFDATAVERMCAENERLKSLCHRMAAACRKVRDVAGKPATSGEMFCVLSSADAALDAFNTEMTR